MINFGKILENDKLFIIFLTAGLLASFILGIFVGKGYAPESEIITVEKPVYIEGETVTKTQIAYVPKEIVVEKYIDSQTGEEVNEPTVERTDMDANIGKTKFIVKLNGEETTFKKSEDEKFVFDKNKIALEQSSTITINTIVKPLTIDKTNRWAIGIGKAEGSGVAYTVDFPIGKSNTFGGWIYKDDDNEAAGIKIKF